MNTYYINYYFNNNIINKLEEKYKNNIILDENYIYLYTNIFEISKFYRFSKKFSNYRDISKEFENNPKILFEELIKYIRETGYYKKDILLLYSIANYYIISHQNFFINLGFKNDLDFLKEKTNLKKINKLFTKTNVFDLYIKDTLTDILNNSYHLYRSNKYLDYSLKKYNHYISHYGTRTFNICVASTFSKNIKGINIKTKKTNAENSQIEENLALIENDALSLLNALNAYLYNNKDEEFKKIIK